MSNIFISYAVSDIEFSRKIVKALETYSLDSWVNWQSIPSGSNWRQQIYKGIEEADVLLFLISPDSVQSDPCKEEITHADKNGKRIVGALIRETPSEAIPPEVEKFQWIPCQEGVDNFDEAIEKISKTIHTDLVWYQFLRELQVKALEWERNGYKNGFLLHDEDLEERDKIFSTSADNDPQPTTLQKQYITVSRIEQEKRLTEREKTSKRLRNRAWIIGGISIVAIITIIFAVIARGHAEEESNARATAQAEAQKQELARRLTSQATLLQADPLGYFEQSTLLAIESYGIIPNVGANEIIWQNLRVFPKPIRAMENSHTPMVFSEDGSQIVSAGNAEIRVWDPATGRETVKIRLDNHFDAVFSLAFSPDGKWVASGSSDGTARVWNVATGQEISRMTHGEAVNSVAFSPDGKWVVSGSGVEYGTARVWEATIGKEISQISREYLFQNGISSVAFSPDGQWVISASAAGPIMVSSSSNTTATMYPDHVVGIVYVWEAATGKEIARMTHGDVITSVAIGPDGKSAVSGSNDRTARVWVVATGKEIARMTHESFVNAVAFSPDGKWVVSGGSDNTARVWNATTGKEISRKTHADSVISVAFSPDGKWVISGSSDGITRVWEVASGKEVARMVGSIAVVSPNGKWVATSYKFNTGIWPLEQDVNIEPDIDQELSHMIHGESVSSAEFSPDQKMVVSVSGGIARVWNTITSEEISRMEGVASAIFMPDGKTIVSGGKDLLIWNAATGKEIKRMANFEYAGSLALNPDGKLVAFEGFDGIVLVWDLVRDREISRMIHYDRDADGFPDTVTCVAFSPDGKLVASGGLDQTVRVWEADSGKEISAISLYESCSSVIFSPNSKLVAAGDIFGAVYLLDTVTGPRPTLRNQTDWDAIVAFSPDGKWVIASGGTDNSAAVFDTVTGVEVARLIHNDLVTAVAFSHNGKWVVSGGSDGARVWDIVKGIEIARITQSNGLNTVAFSPDDKWILTGSDDHTTRVWRWQAEDAISLACERLPRNLTHAEWNQYVGQNIPYHATCPKLPVPEK